MNPLHLSNRVARRALITSLGATLLVSAAAPAWARPAAAIEVDWTCTSVHISADKDLSNVVLGFEDGTEVKFDDLDQGSQGTFSGPGEDAAIDSVWVKAGNNHSGDGPGYGERFDNPLDCGSETEALREDDTVERDDTEQDDSTPDDDIDDFDESGDDGEDVADDADDTTDTDDGSDEGDDGSDEGDEGEDEDESDDAPTPAAPQDPAATPTPVAPEVDATTDEAAGEQPSPAPAADDTDVLGIAFDRAAPRVAAAGSAVRPAPATALPRTGLPLALLALGGLSSLLVGGAALRHARRDESDTTDVPGMADGVQGPTPPASNFHTVSQSVTERDGDATDAATTPRTGVPTVLIAATAAAVLVAGAHVARRR